MSDASTPASAAGQPGPGTAPGTAPDLPPDPGQPVLHQLSANGTSLACWEWRAALRGQGPTLLLVHATGFHGRVWDQVVHHLPGHHVLALELRGHGRSQPFERGARLTSWDLFGRDIAAAAAALGLQQAVAVGHSMGAHALVQAAALQPGRFAQLLLIDPVLLAPAAYLVDGAPPDVPHAAAARKNHFDSPQAMFQRFADRVPYAVFDRQALRDYCEHGLRPALLADGSPQGFELACAPHTEGRIYSSARHNPGIYAAIRALQIPVLVLRARAPDPAILPFDTLGSPTWPALAQEFRQGRDLHLPHKTHLLPMEDPALTAQLIGDLLQPAPSAAG